MRLGQGSPIPHQSRPHFESISKVDRAATLGVGVSGFVLRARALERTAMKILREIIPFPIAPVGKFFSS